MLKKDPSKSRKSSKKQDNTKSDDKKQESDFQKSFKSIFKHCIPRNIGFEVEVEVGAKCKGACKIKKSLHSNCTCKMTDQGAHKEKHLGENCVDDISGHPKSRSHPGRLQQTASRKSESSVCEMPSHFSVCASKNREEMQPDEDENMDCEQEKRKMKRQSHTVPDLYESEDVCSERKQSVSENLNYQTADIYAHKQRNMMSVNKESLFKNIKRPIDKIVNRQTTSSDRIDNISHKDLKDISDTRSSQRKSPSAYSALNAPVGLRPSGLSDTKQHKDFSRSLSETRVEHRNQQQLNEPTRGPNRKDFHERERSDKLVILTQDELLGKQDVVDNPQKESRSKRAKSVSDPVFIDQYAINEWKGKTAKADKIRRGYERVKGETGYICIRIIRGDNYCALRAVLFKTLSSGIDILGNFHNHLSVQQLVWQTMNQNPWIEQWTFANRIPLIGKSVGETLEDCLEVLFIAVEKSTNCHADTDRYKMVLDAMNGAEEKEVYIFEAVKFLMLFTSIKLFNEMQSGQDKNILPALLFARDTSMDPKSFMKNHLNQIGDTCGLDQLEMILLGNTLNVVIKVMRLHRVDEPDFIAKFSNDLENPKDFVTLIAEDDRHYNALSEEP